VEDRKPATAEAAHAWAAETRAMRAAIAQAQNAGRVSRTGAPPRLYELLLSMLDDCDALPASGPVYRLPTMLAPDFPAWAHYVRGVRIWIDTLIEAKAIPPFDDPDSRAFEAWLFSVASEETDPTPRVS
jgi:hypothetical protein